jgi:hypothetical protein
MPWKPAPAELCRRSGKRVYVADKPVRIGGMVFLPNHFTCAKSGVKLNDHNAVVKDGDVYHKSHVPKDVATSVGLDMPEMQRLKQNSVRQSHAQYSKDHRANLGKFTTVADDASVQAASQQQKNQSGAAYKQALPEMAAPADGDAAAAPPAASYEAPAAAEPEPEPAAEHEPEPEAEPEPEPEPDAEPEAEPEPAAEEAAAEGDGKRYKCEYDYVAADADEVSFQEDDFIINANVVDDGWMTGTVERTGESGMLPSNYVVEA